MAKQFSQLAVPLDTAPMEAKIAETLPSGSGWQFEPKWDGFRCLAFRDGPAVELRGKSGKSLTRYFPDVVQLLLTLKSDRFVLDGELAIPLGNALSFDALQLRLHPAESRIRKLAVETPAIFIAFDLLLDPDNRSLMKSPLRERRARLEDQFTRWHETKGVYLSPCAHSVGTARKWLERAGGALDGVVAKRLDQPYESGGRAMIKVKHLRTADCVVGGFRFANNSNQVGSLLLGLYDLEGRLDHVGFRHGTKFLRWRPDKNPRDCTMDQLTPAERPAALIADIATR